MLAKPDKAIRERLAKLESHLENENPLLLDAVIRFKKLDRVAYRMGLLKTSESYATRIPWWPLVTVLGTFSAGKSSFINHFLGQQLQLTGNQAVDDRFTVMCVSGEAQARVLPGVALDADPVDIGPVADVFHAERQLETAHRLIEEVARDHVEGRREDLDATPHEGGELRVRGHDQA